MTVSFARTCSIDHRRPHRVVESGPGVNGYHAFESDKPEASIRALAPERLAEAADFGAGHALSLAIGHRADGGLASVSHRVQLGTAYPEDAARAAAPKLAQIVFEDLVDDRFGQTLSQAEAGKVAVLEPRQAGVGADPERAFRILEQ